MKTNKNIFATLFLVALTVGLIIGCSEEENVFNEKKGVSINSKSLIPLDSIPIAGVDGYTEEQITAMAESFAVGIPEETLLYIASLPSNIKITIFTFYRKSKGCNGFGICEWFPDWPWKISDLAEREAPHYIEINEEGLLNPLIVELKEDVSHLPKEAYEFEVTEDIEIVYDELESLGLKKVIIEAGNYPYNPNIGEFGGYEIPLYGIE
jgi:hypothetical protein